MLVLNDEITYLKDDKNGMFGAIDPNGVYKLPCDAIRGVKMHCYQCGQQVLLHAGEIKVRHFHHIHLKTESICDVYTLQEKQKPDGPPRDYQYQTPEFKRLEYGEEIYELCHDKESIMELNGYEYYTAKKYGLFTQTRRSSTKVYGLSFDKQHYNIIHGEPRISMLRKFGLEHHFAYGELKVKIPYSENIQKKNKGEYKKGCYYLIVKDKKYYDDDYCNMRWTNYHRDQYDLELMLRDNEETIFINTRTKYDMDERFKRNLAEYDAEEDRLYALDVKAERTATIKAAAAAAAALAASAEEAKNIKRKCDLKRAIEVEELNNRRNCESCKKQFTTRDENAWQKKCTSCYNLYRNSTPKIKPTLCCVGACVNVIIDKPPRKCDSCLCIV